MRHILNISFLGHAWCGFAATGVQTLYPIDALTYEEAVAVRDGLIADKRAKVEGKIEIVGFGGDFESITDVCIEQRLWDFTESETPDGRRVTTEVTTTEVIAPWVRPESAPQMDDEA